MAIYSEREGRKVIPLVSADGGATWYPKDGDASKAKPLAGEHIIRLQSPNTIDWHAP